MTDANSTRLIVHRLVIISKGKPVYDESFNSGVNIIRGSNSSGKSTITDFIFYGLGGDFHKWKPEAHQCDYVLLDITANAARLTLKREITDKPRQPMAIFWGPYEEAKDSGAIGWQSFAFQRSQNKSSFSQVLFNAFDLPEVRGDADSNITMHQLLRLLYVDQLSNVQFLLRDEMFDSPLTRRTIADLLFGLYDNSVYQDELELRDSQRQLENLKAQLRSLYDVLAQADQDVDVRGLEKEIVAKEEQLSKIITALGQYDSVTTIEGDSIKEEIEAVRKKYLSKNADLDAAQRAAHSLALDIADSEEFIKALESRVASLDQSLVARDALNDLSMSHCPVCLAPLNTNINEGVCVLCKQPLQADSHKSRIARHKQEIMFQIKESNNLLLEKQDNLSMEERRLPALREEVQVLKDSLNDELRRIRTRRNHELDEMLVARGKLESDIASLHKQAKALTVLAQLQEKSGILQSKINNLQISIRSKRNLQIERQNQTYGKIAEFAAILLKADLPREEDFIDPKDIKLDFEANTFAVNGRNQFSASSIVYLKNCMHYAIFFASLELDFFRYPRFLLCDNMEDKGMEEKRSQNFQEAIVQLAGKQGNDFQIIFTTSMISPSLENTKFCIGEHYSQQKKALKV